MSTKSLLVLPQALVMVQRIRLVPSLRPLTVVDALVLLPKMPVPMVTSQAPVPVAALFALRLAVPQTVSSAPASAVLGKPLTIVTSSYTSLQFCALTVQRRTLSPG